MVELSVIRGVVAISGVIAGFTYYVLTVRNADKARKQMVARQMSQDLTGYDIMRINLELIEMRWVDFDDYMRKYDSAVNKDNYAARAPPGI